MIFGESSFRTPGVVARAQRNITRSKCPHCCKTISIPIDRLRSPGSSGLSGLSWATATPRNQIETKAPALLAFE